MMNLGNTCHLNAVLQVNGWGPGECLSPRHLVGAPLVAEYQRRTGVDLAQLAAAPHLFHASPPSAERPQQQQDQQQQQQQQQPQRGSAGFPASEWPALPTSKRSGAAQGSPSVSTASSTGRRGPQQQSQHRQ